MVSVCGCDQATRTNIYDELFETIKLIYIEEHSQHGWITVSNDYSFSWRVFRYRVLASNELYLTALNDKVDTNNQGRCTKRQIHPKRSIVRVLLQELWHPHRLVIRPNVCE